MGLNLLDELDFPAEIWRPFAEHRPPIRCSPGYLIYLQGTQATCFYYLKQGRVKSFIQSEDGVEQILTIYEPGSLFGEASFFDELPRVSSAVALTVCELVPIDRELVSQQFAQNPALAMTMVKYLARKIHLLSDHVEHIAFRPAKWRLAEYLLTLPTDAGGWTPCQQEELASAVSVSRVTVSRILNELARAEVLALGYRKLQILKREELMRLCSGAT